jgi:hypothetical protein
MILTTRDKLVLQGKRVRVVGSYNIPTYLKRERTTVNIQSKQTGLNPALYVSAGFV